jgi:hypothetical protein
MLPSEVEQGSPAWKAARCGMVSASRIGDVICNARKKGEVSKSRQGYLMELVSERLTGIPEEQFSGKWTDRGSGLEPLARAAYEVLFDVVVYQTGFHLHPTMPFAGCSPDGILSPVSGIQIKAPKTTTHLRWRQKNTVPEEHVPQMYFECCVMGWEWSDFVSYAPSLPEDLQLFVVRLYPEKELMTAMEEAVRQFNDEIEAVLGGLRR